MNKKYYFDILVSAQVNRYNFLVVYEPYRVLEGLKGVGFQGKNCFKKWPQTSPKLILALYNMKKKILLWHFGICLGQCRTDGREYALSLRPITGAGFWKKIFNRSDGDFQQLLCHNQFQRDVHCARNIRILLSKI